MEKAPEIKWTPAQQSAIETLGRDVLVTASAGTGKTAVLSHRAVQRIADPADLARADTMLVLTFTDAAAEEMRSRIAETLHQRHRQTGEAQLRQQLLLLDRAYISTIHSFCKRILTEFFYLIDLNPAFGMLGPDEQRLLKSEILEQTLEQAWSDEKLSPGLESLFKGRRIQHGTNSFVDRIIPLAEFLDSTVDRNRFYENAAALNDNTSAQYTELKNTQKRVLLDKLDQCQKQLSHTMTLDAQYCEGNYITDYLQQYYIPAIETCRTLLEKDRLDLCSTHVSKLDIPRMPAFKKKLWPEELKDLVKDPIDTVKKTLQGLADFALLCPDYQDQLAPQVKLQTEMLLGLLRCFDANYTEAKQHRNMLDFADLEQMALKLLTEHPEAAAKLKERFEYIFVDEYQDINTPQQKLLELLSRDDNVFVVGDIKQSIYGFRQSQPEIFLQRLLDAEDVTNPSNKPGRVDLQDNFRCRGEIIDFVNTLFGRVMTKTTADMDYDQRAELVSSFNYPDFQSHGPIQPVELILMDEQASEDEPTPEQDRPTQSISASQRQAAWIADRIQQIVGTESGRPEFQVYDKKTDSFRDVQYRDIVILMRSLSHRAQEYTEILRLAGVPISSQSACGYFETTEITDCLCLLKVLDNPDRDIELAALLRGPIFGITDNQLAMIRLHSKHKDSFYQAVRNYADNGHDKTLKQALSDILLQIHNWRQQIRIGSLADFLDKVFRERNLLSFYSALPNGAQRRANLLKLHDYAIQFEHFRTTEPGAALGRFVEFLEKLDKTEQDWAPAEADSSSENAVRIMSVHRSKGLEFPVVFAAELNTRFNMRDCSGQCLIDDNLLGLQIVNAEAGSCFDSMAHQVIAEKKKRTSLAEEMRILYVALTRAREKLILTANQKFEQTAKLLSSMNYSGRLPDWKIGTARSSIEWILMGFADRPILNDALQTKSDATNQNDSLFHFERIDRHRIDALTDEILNAKKTLKKNIVVQKISSKAATAHRLIQTSLQARYPCESVTQTPAKLSVSELTHRDDEYTAADLTRGFTQQPEALAASRAISNPLSLGSAVHLIFEHLDLSGPCDITAIQSTLQMLVDTKRIPCELEKIIDSEMIAAFFHSEPGQLAMATGQNVLREWPFTYALQADSQDESIILQGIVDMIIPTKEGLAIVDFKTDRITESTLPERRTKYTPQLNYYARAAGNILKQPVVSAWLYFLQPCLAVQVDLTKTD